MAFWPERGALRLSLNLSERLGTLFRADGIALNADGTPRPSPPDLRYHPCMTYFRRSETESDLSDSYRYAYLALESILSDVRPQRADEGEGEWLTAALTEAHRMVGLSPDFAVGGRDPVEAAKKSWYNDERLRLFHSKSNRPTSAVLSEREYELLLKKKHDLLTLFIGLCRR